MNLKCLFKNFISSILLKIYYPRVTFRIIEKLEDIEKMYNLIWKIYAFEKKYIDPTRFSLETLKDEFESVSIHLGAFNRDNIIGTLRIILPSEKAFYIEKDFNVDISKLCREKCAEISRLAVLKKYRNKLISFGLLKKALEISKKKKIEYWLIVVPEKIKNYFSKSFGIKFYSLNVKELTEKQLKIRERMSNYYKICNPSPYLISLKEIYQFL